MQPAAVKPAAEANIYVVKPDMPLNIVSAGATAEYSTGCMQSI